MAKESKENNTDGNKTDDEEKKNKSAGQNSNKASGGSFLTDLKLTILTNAIWIAVIAYLYHQLSLTWEREKSFADCGEYFSHGHRTDGIYEIKPSKSSEDRISVYCNMTAGGWTLLFKRDTTEKFDIDWQLPLSAYKFGFGDLSKNHFLGLDNFNLLTRDKERQLMVFLNRTSFRYKNFKVLNEYYNYKLIIENEIDKMPDESSLLRLNNTLFSTIDVDFDLAVNSNCSSGWKAGWWFTDCFDKSSCLPCLIMHGTKGVKKLSYASMLIK